MSDREAIREAVREWIRNPLILGVFVEEAAAELRRMKPLPDPNPMPRFRLWGRK